ncbi:MAG TPA: Uma2 family endonuclease [Gemmatimonadaceae bacterium]|nr:Uma2 family endonuclease [Gemmatimonadaceae bacterium]
MSIAGTERKHWTAADLREIPDDRNRYEIIDGELFMTPSPSWSHQLLSQEIFRVLDPYVATHGIGQIIWAPADVEFADDTVVEPDLFVVPLVEGRKARSWEDVGRLLVVIEILSQSTARADRTVKRRRYQSEGVPEYWIVDGNARVVERWRPEDDRPEILADNLQWRPDLALPALVIDLPKLFTTVFGE